MGGVLEPALPACLLLLPLEPLTPTVLVPVLTPNCRHVLVHRAHQGEQQQRQALTAAPAFALAAARLPPGSERPPLPTRAPPPWAPPFLPFRAPPPADTCTNPLGASLPPRCAQAQVENMTNKWHVYMTFDGRISMAGLSADKCDYMADAIIDSVTNA